jgi:hypothetical protein
MSSMGTVTRRRQKARPNGSGGKQQVAKIEATPQQYDAAVAFEVELAAKAAEIRGDATTLTPDLFLKLWPLLREPIPEGFLVEATRGEGKPYDSKGIRSVQIPVDRMDAVLTPLWWWYEHTYEQGGKLCLVTVNIGTFGERVLVSRSSYGGMNRGSTEGNLYKGTFTNAAKRAFALIGPGHEIYAGAADYEPDVSPAAAREQVRRDTEAVPSSDEPVSPEKAAELVDAAWVIGMKDKLGEAISFVVGADVGDCSNMRAATAAMRSLTPMQAAKVERWLNKAADQMAAQDEARALAEQASELNGGGRG